MLVITGTQRSGTSLIAKALIESGYDIGADWFDEKVQGGYEWPPACMVFRNYLGDPTFPFDDFTYPEGLDRLTAALVFASDQRFQEMTHGSPDQLVCKFSYLMMNPAFVYIWAKLRPNDTLLMMRRDPEFVVKSKKRHKERFEHDSPLLQQNEDELRVNVRMSAEAVHRLYPQKARTLLFPEEMDLEIINLELKILDPRVQITQEAWDKVYDPSKIHIR